MHKSLILELINNGKHCADRTIHLDNKKYIEYNSALFALIGTLCEDLSEEKTDETIEKICDVLGNMEGVVADEYFKHGFRLGLMLAAQNFLD